MRGKLSIGNVSNHGKGITPAYAGKTFAQYDTITAYEDHPRVCGENI